MECELLVQKFFPLLLIKWETLINSAVMLILTVFSFENYNAETDFVTEVFFRPAKFSWNAHLITVVHF